MPHSQAREHAAHDAAARRMSADVGKAKALFFLAALLSLFASVYLFFFADRIQGIFVGLWVPAILSAGSLILAGARHE